LQPNAINKIGKDISEQRAEVTTVANDCIGNQQLLTKYFKRNIGVSNNFSKKAKTMATKHSNDNHHNNTTTTTVTTTITTIIIITTTTTTVTTTIVIIIITTTMVHEQTDSVVVNNVNKKTGMICHCTIGSFVSIIFIDVIVSISFIDVILFLQKC
jgi:hypothetical protein